ncbi:MCP four helix bundle domain-containing protein [Arcobacter sp. F2176]|uniref:MCP four helix bundle domain-containing protein n=1 Tax=Arcobacter sp. F2176 TaxID=2044511 RepID=UPI00100A5336|nr:MCP four helix bundle domain-containing protein [Arcobacter sp. F2176]RXJ77122.1 hypothetical protein CRU95_16100 [Arcobacter sp. F2176]
MFKNMTIKMKLIASFITIVILIVCLAVYSIYSINESADGFTSYRAMAKDTVLSTRIEGNVLDARISVIKYLNADSQKNIDDFEKSYKKIFNIIDIAKKEIIQPNRASKIVEIQKNLITYKEGFSKVIKYTKDKDKILTTILNVNGKKIEVILSSIFNVTKNEQDHEASYITGNAIRSFLLARLYTMKFLDTESKDAYDRVESEFNILSNNLMRLKSTIKNSNRITQLNELLDLIQIYTKGVKEVYDDTLKKREIVEEKINVIGPKIADLSEEVKLSIRAEQDLIGPAVQKLNSNIKLLITIISIIILTLAIFLAIALPRNIANLLNTFQEGLIDFFKYLNR